MDATELKKQEGRIEGLRRKGVGRPPGAAPQVGRSMTHKGQEVGRSARGWAAPSLMERASLNSERSCTHRHTCVGGLCVS